MEYLSTHPAILTGIIIFVAVAILYFIFKQFIKLAIVILLIALLAGGYYYLQDPKKMTEKLKTSMEKVQTGTDKVVEKSKTFYKDSKELLGKAKEMPGDVGTVLKKATDQNKK